MGTVLVTSDTVPTHWPLRTLYLSLAGWYKQVSRNIHTKVWVGYILVIGPVVVSMQLAASAENYIGTLQDFLFIDEVTVRVVAMNEPVSFFNVAIGRGDKNS